MISNNEESKIDMNTLENILSDAKLIDKSNGDNPIITAPKLDKLSAVIPLKDELLCGMAYNGMLSWIEHNETGVIKVPGSARYPLAVKLLYPDKNDVIHLNGPSLRLEITSKKATKRQLRLEYNPSYMTEAAELYLNVMMVEITGLEFYELLHHARFTRVDFFRNIMFRDLQDYLINAKWAKASQSFSCQGEKLQTVNLGKSGGIQIIAYDKTKQLYGDNADHSTIRIETRCRINHTLKELAKFKNPFERVQVYSVNCKNPPLGVPHWRAFQDSCRMRGINNAIKNQPANCRAKLKKALSMQPVPWWDISPDDWSWLLTDALDNAGLLQIPNTAPPLDFYYHTGQAA